MNSVARRTFRLIHLALIVSLLSGVLYGAPRAHGKKKQRSVHRKSRTVAVAKRGVALRRASYTPMRRPVSRRWSPRLPNGAIVRGGPWFEPTYADATVGDNVDGEDLEIRRFAVEALNGLNGSVVVVDPNTGRILTMVNQRLALGSGFQPCSTIKVAVALAALSEHVVDRNTKVRLYGRYSMNMTDALARSNNYYFANLGNRLGFTKVSRYARLFGYGEKAGLNIAGEQPGKFPSEPPRNGGVGMLTSFGEEISQTPLQLAALMSAMENGGKLYYLQYPRSQQDVQAFVPKVKRQLDIARYVPEVKPGMIGAVEFGTARRAKLDEPIAGKTGTCTDSHTHLGWFGSFNDVGENKLVVIVLLTGGRPAIGPAAAAVAGDFYRRLAEKNHLAIESSALTPATLVSSQICCAR
jgi:penicillin-binding protein 2